MNFNHIKKFVYNFYFYAHYVVVHHNNAVNQYQILISLISRNRRVGWDLKMTKLRGIILIRIWILNIKAEYHKGIKGTEDLIKCD